MSERQCPVCKGRGKFQSPRTGETVTCDWCDGKGTVTT